MISRAKNFISPQLAVKQRYLENHPRANPDIARNNLKNYAELLQIDRWAKVVLQERRLTLEIDQGARAQEAQLDGCYVIKTDVPGSSKRSTGCQSFSREGGLFFAARSIDRVRQFCNTLYLKVITK